MGLSEEGWVKNQNQALTIQSDVLLVYVGARCPPGTRPSLRRDGARKASTPPSDGWALTDIKATWQAPEERSYYRSKN
jgi:hypothetical protein